MAVNRNSILPRSSVLALVIATMVLPGVAQADPENGGRGWQSRGEGGREARSDNGGGGGWQQQRQAAPQQSQAPAPQQSQRNWSPPPQAQQQSAPPPQARQADWSAGNRGGNGWSGGNRNWNGGGQAPQAAPVPQQSRQAQGGWNGNPPVERRRSEGNGWQGDAARGRNWNGGGQAPQAAPPPPPQQTRQAPGGWSGGDRRGGNWQGEANRGGTWNGGRQMERQHNEASWNQRQGRNWTDADNRHRDGDHDWRDGDRRGDRQYWQNRNWNNHWDRSRRNNWSGWNIGWNWSYGNDYNRWNTRWRNNSRYDWYDYRSSYPDYYRVGSYYAPYRGYSYHRLSIGFFLDELFFGENYWIANPGYYRLPDVYGPYRWVRYYDDAVLVDIYSGEVVDVIYDFFW